MVLPEGDPGQHSVSAKPRPDESLTGYIFRLAARRRWKSAFQLAHDFGFNHFSNRPRREWLEALATSAQVPFADLEAISFGLTDTAVGWFRGVELPSVAFDRLLPHDRRICPLCLRDSPHHRAIWDLMFISACPVHAVRLLAACRKCGEPLRWPKIDLTRCRCGADLTRMGAESIPEVELRGTKAVHGLLGDERFMEEGDYAQSLEPLRDLDAGKSIEFLFRLGLETIGARRKVFSCDAPGELVWKAHVALSRALQAAERWPEGYWEVLELMRVRSGKSAWPKTFVRSVIPVRRWLDRLPEGSGKAIRLATTEFRADVKARYGASGLGRKVARRD